MVIENSNLGFEDLLKNFFETRILIYFLPDKYFMRKLDKNPFYPFNQLNAYLFEYSYRYYYTAFFNTILTVILTFISIINCVKILNFKSISSWFTVLLLFLLSILSFILSLISFTKRTLRLDLMQNKYQVFIENKLIACNHLHNIYIRLSEKHIVKTKIVYRLMLCGKNIDTIPISPYSYSLQLFRRLGRRLAQNLYLNYFDIHDLSSHHTILNYCPLNSNKTDLWRFLIQEKEIILQKKLIYWLKPNVARHKIKIYSSNLILKTLSRSISILASEQNHNRKESSVKSTDQQRDLSSQDIKDQLSKLANTIRAVKILAGKQS
jgi:hypothetical protein